jgi:cellulose synthase operon protein C
MTSAYSQAADDMYAISREHFLKFEKATRTKEIEISTLNDEILTSRIKLISRKYDNAIQEIVKKKESNADRLTDALRRFVSSYPEQSDIKAHALLVLGDQYFTASETKYLENEVGDNKKPKVLPDFSEAIEVYNHLITAHSGYRYIDIAYYLLGVCYLYEERLKDALRVWQQLVDKFPESLLNDEVWFRLGDEKFNERDFKAAAAYYQKIINPNFNFYDKALYKLAWTYYILNQFDEAITGFAKVLEFQNLKTSKISQLTSILSSESEQYLAISFFDKAEMNEQGPTSLALVKNYFSDTGHRPYERNVLIYLGDALLKVAKNQEAEQVFFYAISLNPLHPKNPDLSYRLVQFYDEAGMLDEAGQARKNMLTQYLPGSAWDMAMHAQGQKQTLQDTRKLLREVLLKQAFFEHARARQKAEQGKSEEAIAGFKNATRSYMTYVKLYPEQEDLDQALFFLSEAAFDAQWFEDAGYVFSLLRDWPWQTQYREKAALNATFAYRRQIEAQKFDFSSIQTKNKGQLLGAMLPVFEKFIVAADKLFLMYPEEENLPSFLFESAGIYYYYGDNGEANKRFMQIVERFPGLEVARLSADLILEDKLVNGLWSEAASEAVKFQTAKIGKDAEFRRIEISARFKDAEEKYEAANLLLKSGKSLDAKLKFAVVAQIYATLLHDDPKSEFVDKMLYNRGMALSLSEQPVEAFLVFERLYHEFPKSDLSKDAMLKCASYFERSLQFHKAAETYLLMSRSYPQAKQAGDALLNAGLLFEIDEDEQKASSVFFEFNQRYADRVEAADALRRATQLNNKQSITKGEAQFAALQKEFARFKGTKINGGTGKKQSQQLVDKTKQLALLQKKYEDMARQFPNSKLGLAALYQIGSLYEELFRALLKTPCPRDVALVDASACDEYKSLLEDKAIVLEEKAINAFLLVKKSQIKNIGEDEDWVLRAEDALHRLRPGEYGVAGRPLIGAGSFAACPYFANTKEEVDAAHVTLIKNPKDVKSRLSIAHLFYTQGKYETAVIILHDTLEFEERNPCVQVWLGHNFSHQRKWTEAVASYKKAIAFDSVAVGGDLYVSLGTAYFMNQQYDEAKDSYEQALKFGTKLPQVYFNLGLLYMDGNFTHLETLVRLSMAQDFFEQYLQKATSISSVKNRIVPYLTLLQQKIQIEKQKAEAILKGSGK